MNKSQRIRLSSGTTNNDKYIKVQLEQDVDTLEFLTMSLDTKDVYGDFNADYGVLVGRVLANDGVGVPNARISVFIPLSDEDSTDNQVFNLYPYKTPRDKNNDGKRYNLLPRVAKEDPITGIVSPKQPFGSFPIKEEIITNPSFLNVYKKYYKYTALTNIAGDYMIFGVPIGTQTIHLSVDITDIGKYSMNPAAMVTNLGYSPNLFTDNGSKIKSSTDLGDLPNIETQEITVDIIPFWGDTTNFTIGITRQDFRIRSVLSNTFVIFGTAFTDGDDSMWGDNSEQGHKRIREFYHIFQDGTNDQDWNCGMASKRNSKIIEKIYYYPASVTDAEINSGSANADPKTKMLLLDSSEYSVYKRDGDFVFIISCNRNKIITDELGSESPVADNSPVGIFTKFRGFITLEYSDENLPMNFSQLIGSNERLYPYRFKLKIPQYAAVLKAQTVSEDASTIAWRKQHYTFSGGTLYSVARFHGTVINAEYNDKDQHFNAANNFLNKDTINQASNTGFMWNTGIIQTNNAGDVNNSQYQMVSNVKDTNNRQYFGANWLNFAVYLPQFGYLTRSSKEFYSVRTATHFSKQVLTKGSDNNDDFLVNNTQIIAAGQINTKFYPRSDLNWTDFIIVDKADAQKMKTVATKGFKKSDLGAYTLKGTYRNGVYKSPKWTSVTTACPFNGGKKNGNPANAIDTEIYFYKGFAGANCIDYIISLGLV